MSEQVTRHLERRGTYKVIWISDAFLVLDVRDDLARRAEKSNSISDALNTAHTRSYLPAPVSPLEGLIALDFDQSAKTQLTLLDLGACAWLGPFAASTVRAGVLDAIRHDEDAMDGCQSVNRENAL